MNKKHLSFVALIIQIASVFMPFIDGVFVWHVYTMNLSTNIFDPMSFSGLYDTQWQLGFLVIVLVVLILLNVAANIVSLFKEMAFMKKKTMIVLPAITLIYFILLCVIGSDYSDSFVYNFELRYIVVHLGAVFWIETVLLGFSALLEGLKLFSKETCEKEQIV